MIHEIAFFLHFYPSYKYQDVLEENSFRILSLLSEAYRVQAEERLDDIAVGSVPHIGKEGRKLVDAYDKQANGGILELIDDKGYSSQDELKKALGQ